MGSPLRILTIDCECLPGHWIGGDYVSKRLTAVAWKWGDVPGGPKSVPEVFTHYEMGSAELACRIADAIEAADIVTGHYIRGFDLPLINGNLLQAGLPPLNAVMTHDTKLDLLKAHGRSQSQENLASELGLSEPKVKVTLPEWEAFNLREPGARERGVERVVQDVIQNEALRARLLELGWLGRVKRWDPQSKGASYRP